MNIFLILSIFILLSFKWIEAYPILSIYPEPKFVKYGKFLNIYKGDIEF